MTPTKTDTRRRFGERLFGRPVTLRMTLVGATGVAIVALVGFFGTSYHLFIGALVAVYAIAVIGLDFIGGHGGQMSFGHNAFLAIGCYSTAYLTTKQGWSPLEAILAGMAISLIVAFVVGFPTLRLRGIYMVTATIALGLAASALVVSLDSVTGGSSGIAGIPAFRVGGLEFKGAGSMFWLAWGLVVVSLWLVTRLVNSRYGLALRTVAMDHDVAQSLAVNPHVYKVSAFCISAVMTSVAGSLLAHLLRIASPEAVSFVVQVKMFTMLFIGGLGNDFGIVVGAAAVVILPEILVFAKDYFPMMFGALILVILILRPRGLLAPGTARSGGWFGSWASRITSRVQS